MISFSPITLEDAAWICPLLKEANYQGSEYSFTNHYCWKNSYHIQVAQFQGFYLAKTTHRDKTSYLMPVGKGPLREPVAALMQDAQERQIPFQMHGVLAQKYPELQEEFPGVFHIQPVREIADYIYDAVKLKTLTGKKLHSKRNHINRFRQKYPRFDFSPISQENLPQCVQLHHVWGEYHRELSTEDLNEELGAVQMMLDHFQQLHLQGGILQADGEPVAYTIGEPLNHNTYVIHAEKALYHVPGAYPMINQLFAQSIDERFCYINREEDMGDEGLRKAKLSYQPAYLLEKAVVTLMDS